MNQIFMTLLFSISMLFMISCADESKHLVTTTESAEDSGFDCVLGNPEPGAVCRGGAIYLGSLEPGAISGTGIDRYMTTPGGCGEIPAGKLVDTGNRKGSYPSGGFTPTCSGQDDPSKLEKWWNDGGSSYDLNGLTNYIIEPGIGNGEKNKDHRYGSYNTLTIVSEVRKFAAARYCDQLVFGGYSDWYLPNRYELNLFFNNKDKIPGLNKSGIYYWSSTEANEGAAWSQRFSDGDQRMSSQSYDGITLRCVRRFK